MDLDPFGDNLPNTGGQRQDQEEVPPLSRPGPANSPARRSCCRATRSRQAYTAVSCSSSSQPATYKGCAAGSEARTGIPIEFAISSRRRSRLSLRSIASAAMTPMTRPARAPSTPSTIRISTGPRPVALVAGSSRLADTRPIGLLALLT